MGGGGGQNMDGPGGDQAKYGPMLWVRILVKTWKSLKILKIV